jgi:hypothetical protein
MNEQGYEVHMHYVHVTPKVAVERSLKRFEATGRFVDPNFILHKVGTRPRDTFHELKTYPRVKTATQYDNNGPELVQKYNPNHHPAGSSLGGQFAPKATIGFAGGQTFDVPLSQGTSSMPQLYNKSVQALGKAFEWYGQSQKQGELVYMINSIKGPPAAHSFGQKFAKIKAEALALAEAYKAPKPPPQQPEINLPWKNKHTWNNNLAAKLTQAANSPNPLVALAFVQVSGQAHPLVKQYKNDLLAHFGQQSAPQGGVNHVAPTPKIAPPPGIAGPKVKGPPPSIHPDAFQDVTGMQAIHGNLATTKAKLDAAYATGNVSNIMAVPTGKITGKYKDFLAAKLSQHITDQPTATTAKPVDISQASAKLAASVAKVPAKPTVPDSPKLDTSFPVAEQQLFMQKIKMLQDAYHSADPIEALNSISAYSPAVGGYKQAMLDKLTAWENSKPKAAVVAGSAKPGEVHSYFKVLADTGMQMGVLPPPHPIQSSDKFFDKGMAWRQALPPNERKAVDSYNGGGYSGINGKLRHGETHQYTTAIDKALAKSTIDHDVQVMRKMSSADFGQASQKMIGKIAEDPAFASTSISHGVWHGNVHIKINVPAGTRGAYLSTTMMTGEKEILLPRKTRYRIDHVEDRGAHHNDGRFQVHMTVLPKHEQTGWTP